jgi:hypothetical protein
VIGWLVEGSTTTVVVMCRSPPVRRCQRLPSFGGATPQCLTTL